MEGNTAGVTKEDFDDDRILVSVLHAETVEDETEDEKEQSEKIISHSAAKETLEIAIK